MLKRFAVLMVASLCIIALLAACGGGDDNGDNGDSGGGSGDTVTLELTEMKFTPNTFTVKAGEKVTVKLENKGSVLHDFSIDSLDVKEDVQPGDSKEVSFTAPSDAGDVEFYCNQPGHKAAGMKGTMTVE